ncbi:hypothetical protein KA005_65490 [bacterium]|nr:hypothetical protein [bacterium]
MTTKKAIPFRYREDLEENIRQLAEIASYNKTKNEGITLAVKLAVAVIGKIEKMKKIKDMSDLRSYIQDTYGINLWQLR